MPGKMANSAENCRSSRRRIDGFRESENLGNEVADSRFFDREVPAMTEHDDIAGTCDASKRARAQLDRSPCVLARVHEGDRCVHGLRWSVPVAQVRREDSERHTCPTAERVARAEFR